MTNIFRFYFPPRRVYSATGWLIIACLASVYSATQAIGELDRSAYSEFYTPFRDDLADEWLERSVTATGLVRQPFMREVPWAFSSGIPPFFRESLVQVVARTFYLTRDNLAGSTSQAWSGGGWLAYRSGLAADMFGVHAALYTSQRLFGPADEAGTLLLNPDQKPLNMLGQGYGRIKILDQEFRGGRQLVDTPLINAQDNRMVPTTFEGAVFTTLPDNKRDYDYSVGYLWNVKQRDSNDFISLSDALTGGDVPNSGASFGMIKYRPLPGLEAIFQDYIIKDVANTSFAQLEYKLQLPPDVPQWIVGANIIDQRSVGAGLLSGSPFQTYQISAKAQMTYMGWLLFVAGSATGEQSKIFNTFAFKPTYTVMLQQSFENAGEKALGANVAYDFGDASSPMRLAGLSAGAWYSHGWSALNPSTALRIPGRDELDIWIQYRPSEGPLKGLRVKMQYSNVWQQGNVRDRQPELQFITDYTILFR